MQLLWKVIITISKVVTNHEHAFFSHKPLHTFFSLKHLFPWLHPDFNNAFAATKCEI